MITMATAITITRRNSRRIAITITIMIIDHDHDHDDHHDHSDHDHAHHADYNFRAAYFHVLADAVTSLLAISALVAAAYFDLPWLDPVAGFLGTIVITRLGLQPDQVGRARSCSTRCRAAAAPA